MRLTAQEFAQLEKEWYSKLHASGFEDIERELKGKKVLCQWSKGPKHDVYKDWEVKQAYYLTLEQKLSNPKTKFRCEVDKFILCWHNEGITHKSIVARLHEMGICKHRNTVRNIIWRYQWQWKMRSNPPKYLKPNQPTLS